MFVFILASGIAPMWSWLELIPLVALLVIFSAGVGMLLSALYVRFRDVQPIWEVFLQLLYYGSPILYTVQTAADHHFLGIPFSRILVLNPLGAILTQARKALLQPSAPSAAAGARRLRTPADPARDHRRAVRARPVVLQPRGPADLGEAVAMSAAETSNEQQLQAENERLRARVAALEAELVEIQARTNAAVAEWQERAYWLDRCTSTSTR